MIALFKVAIISGSSDSHICLFVVELSDDEGMEYLVKQEKDRASESQVCLLIFSTRQIKVLCMVKQLLGMCSWCSALLLLALNACLKYTEFCSEDTSTHVYCNKTVITSGS